MATPSSTANDLVVLHAQWTDGLLHLWGERGGAGGASATGVHPGSVSAEELARALADATTRELTPATIRLNLPSMGDRPLPSPQVAHWTGHVAHEDGGAPALREWKVATLAIDAEFAPALLERLEEIDAEAAEQLLDEEEGHAEASAAPVAIGDSVRFFSAAARVARWLLADQRFVPSLEQDQAGAARAGWRPWLTDTATHETVATLVGAMPPSARAVVDEHGHRASEVVEDYLAGVIDAACRRVMLKESMHEAIEGRPVDGDPHVTWLSGLLVPKNGPVALPPRSATLTRAVTHWLAALDDRGAGGQWRLCLTLHEPMIGPELADLTAPGEDIRWDVTLGLQSVESERTIVDAEDIWSWRSTTATIDGRRLDNPHDLFLKELGRAARLYKPLEEALEEPSPTGFELSTSQAYQLLREIRPILIDQGFGVICPDWWDTPSARIGSRLQLFSAPAEDDSGNSTSAPGSVARAQLGLHTLVGYEWKLAVGDVPLTLEEFEKLASQRAPLVRIDGRWVEIRPDDVKNAMKFIRENPGGEIRFGDAMRMAYTSDKSQTGLPILGIDAQGWVADLIGAEANGPGFASQAMQILEPPKGFKGELRPYQLKGLSWLSFLDRFGFGPCLADDMGLGKTIQLLALLLHEREQARANGEEGVGPTLLVVPMSIVGNWTREAERFAPTLTVIVHHGSIRLAGEEFFQRAATADLVITTYALAHRDRETLEKVGWHRVVLDEAQNIKNPGAKQSKALREMASQRRVALTGTPLENRLTELWSIMDFCNPGLLGTMGDFKRNFSLPVERYHDASKARQLRSLVRPFILRRLKTDPSVISDLPSKVETKEYCRLTSEQAQLYEACVKGMLAEVEAAEGIRRRGIVLTSLIRLKQICNHPAQMLKEDIDAPMAPAESAKQDAALTGPPAHATRSGKCIRLIEMLEEVIAAGDQALVFTQFRQMGVILASMLRHAFGKEVLLLHGGTPSTQRQAMIDRFQKADGTTPIFILSLKAGGVGLNLTAASHVFHFDRWWNPAVENQATDRAFRIGQTKTVNVHKFVVSGTLEEKIDQMIESKIALAEDVIGSGEDWLTELSTNQLRELLTLRPEAVGEE